MSLIQITAGAEADLPIILEMIRALASYERLSDQCVASEEKLRATLFGEERGPEVLVARVDGIPAGFALFFHTYSTFLAQRGLYLEDLFVKPAYRGHGVGRALLERLAQVAVGRNCGRFEWSVLDWNEPAIGFYRRLGAMPMGDWTMFRITGDALRRLAAGRCDDQA
jgi:GNAT superfamily N-acetyltransferase